MTAAVAAILSIVLARIAHLLKSRLTITASPISMSKRQNGIVRLHSGADVIVAWFALRAAV